MRALVGSRDERAAKAASSAITEQVDHRLTAVRSLARQANSTDSPEHVLADAAYFLPNFDGGLALFTPEGALLTASGDFDFWQSSYVAAKVQAIVTDEAFQQDLWLATTLTHPTTQNPLTLVVSTTENGPIAAGAFSPISLAERALQDLFTESEAAAFILDGDGRLLYQTGSLLWSQANLGQHPGVAEALNGESGTTYLDSENEEHVIAFSPIPLVNWALVIEEPWRSVAGPLLAATEYAPLVLAPALIIALVALWFGARQIVRPLQSLEQKASALGWGDFEAINQSVGGVEEIQRLQTELIHMAQKVQAAQRGLRGYLSAVTTGQEEERQRLARDLHDETIQSLIALNQRVQLAQMSGNGRSSADQLSEMQTMITQIIADLRRLSRDLRPIYLEDLGLIPALDMLTREAQNGTGAQISFRSSGQERRLSPHEELALYRIVQEALSNIGRHAQATQAEVYLHFSPECITLEVQDNGCGFTVPDSPAEMTMAGHFGLLGVQERAEMIGGRLHINSAPESGTNLTITLKI
jgi:signal transduction histidine kinase